MTAPRLETCHGGRYWSARLPDRRAIGLGSVAKVSPKEARRRFAELVWAQGAAPGDHAPGKITLSDWCARYMASRDDLADGTRDLLDLTIRYLLVCYGNPKLSALAGRGAKFREHLKEQAARRGGHLSPHSVALHLRNAKAILAAAVPAEIGANPFAGVKPPLTEIREDWRMVTLPELGQILGACPDDGWRCLFGLCRLAGLRLGHRGGEALELAWPQVDWAARTLRARDQKRRRWRVVPICPQLYGLLRGAFERAEFTTGLVCVVSRSNLDADAKAIIRAAGLAPWSKPFHSLRKSCESEWLNDPKLALPLVAGWLGNSPAVALKHYHRRDSEHGMAEITGLTRAVDSQHAGKDGGR